MLRAESLLANLDRLFPQRLCCRVLPVEERDDRQVMQGLADTGITWSEQIFLDLERPQAVATGLFVDQSGAPARFEQHVQQFGSLDAVRIAVRREHRQPLVRSGLGLLVVAVGQQFLDLMQWRRGRFRRGDADGQGQCDDDRQSAIHGRVSAWMVRDSSAPVGSSAVTAMS